MREPGVIDLDWFQSSCMRRRPPLGFRQLQSIDWSIWRGRASEPQFV